jgi:phage protein D
LPGDLRQPRLRVLANNTELPGVVAAEITSNNHYAADRFRLTLQTGAHEAAAWADTDSVLLDIQLALDGQTYTSVIQGEVDQLHLNPITGCLNLDGRDLTARLLEARTQETFTNQTSSDIAATLAARRGLSVDLEPTKTPVGAYWQLEHDRITLDSFSRATTEWDLLVTLAAHEGFNVWVTGTILHFRPEKADQINPPEITPSDVLSLELERALTLAHDIEVTVKSWNSRQAHAFTQTARATRSGGKGGGGGKAKTQRYVYVVPNLTPDNALKLAQSRLAELSRHERVISAEMPGELDLVPRQQIQLTGTNTALDQTYWIDEITRRIDFHHGFTQHLRARNATTGSQSTSPADPIGGSPWNAS